MVDELIITIGMLAGESSSSGSKAAKRAVVGGEQQDNNKKRKTNGKEKAYESDDSSPPDLEIRAVGDMNPVVHKGVDTWGLVGTEPDIPDALWNYDGGNPCTVSHYLGKHIPKAATQDQARSRLSGIPPWRHCADSLPGQPRSTIGPSFAKCLSLPQDGR